MEAHLLERIGVVKTARREVESVLLARALLRNEPLASSGTPRLVELAKNNKVLLRTLPFLKLSHEIAGEAEASLAEALDLYDMMSKAYDELQASFVVIKSFDSLPDIGHDLDFLIPSRTEFERAKELLVKKLNARPQNLTHCDKLVGKFSCYLPRYLHDFELYPTISQLGEEHIRPQEVLAHRRKEVVAGREIWLTSDVDRVVIRVIHAMYRHNFLKLSDILDFAKLSEKCSLQQVLDGIARAGMGDAFVFFLATIDRFLKACQVDYPHLEELKREAVKSFGRASLSFLRNDRLVLPYRIPSLAVLMLFLLKAGRDVSRGRLKSSLRCLLAPPLIFLNFVNAVFGDRLFKKIW